MTFAELAVIALRRAADTIEQRSKEYNGNSFMFQSIADKTHVTVDDVFNILIAIKKERLISNEKHTDSLVDMVAYQALHAVHSHPITASTLLPRDQVATKASSVAIINYDSSFRAYKEQEKLEEGMEFYYKGTQKKFLGPLIAKHTKVGWALRGREVGDAEETNYYLAELELNTVRLFNLDCSKGLKRI